MPTSSQSVLMTVHVSRRATREGSPTVTMIRTLMSWWSRRCRVAVKASALFSPDHNGHLFIHTMQIPPISKRDLVVQWEVVKRTMHQRVFHHFSDGGAGKAEARVDGLLGTCRVPRRVLHPAIFPRRLAWKAVPSLLPQDPEWSLRFPRGL